MKYQNEIQDSIAYLSSKDAEKSLAANHYWPKWNSPWWHMLLLHELGETKRIPQQAIKNFIHSMNKFPLKIFPLHQSDLPRGLDLYDTYCHCQLGTNYQVLYACGVNVDKELPWMRSWFLNYQMTDGGLNCDNDAYLVKDECPSSMVATISAFEAILYCTDRQWTHEEKIFLERAAKFLVERKLLLGSSSKHNSEEREQANSWVNICFPRFYFYDILRGLRALLVWQEKTNNKVPKESFEETFNILDRKFGEGPIRIERRCYDNVATRYQYPSGEWVRKHPATYFPLLTKVSEPGETSDVLTHDWQMLRKKLFK